MTHSLEAVLGPAVVAPELRTSAPAEAQCIAEEARIEEAWPIGGQQFEGERWFEEEQS
jgi:hypothetical protein